MRISEYWVSHKRMNDSGNRIIKVKAMKSNEKLQNSDVYRRTMVVESIEESNDWYTCRRKDEKTWTKGEKIHIVEVNGEKFIRTDKNKIKSDNLGELPDF